MRNSQNKSRITLTNKIGIATAIAVLAIGIPYCISKTPSESGPSNFKSDPEKHYTLEKVYEYFKDIVCPYVCKD